MVVGCRALMEEWREVDTGESVETFMLNIQSKLISNFVISQTK